MIELNLSFIISSATNYVIVAKDRYIHKTNGIM